MLRTEQIMSTKSSSDDGPAIQQTVMRYINGIAQSNPDAVASAFHPKATMTGHFGGTFKVVEEAGKHIADYMRSIQPTSVHSPQFKGSILSVTQEANMATVSIAEDQLQGHDMRSFFHLHKVDGKWLITAKATTVL
jgi:Putative lumazine-binding